MSSSSKENAFFLCKCHQPVARKPEKNTFFHPFIKAFDTFNPYVAKFLKKTKWKPNKMDVFASVVDYPRYNFFDRFMIKVDLFMWITFSNLEIPFSWTDAKARFEFTDWKRVEDFSKFRFHLLINDYHLRIVN